MAHSAIRTRANDGRSSQQALPYLHRVQNLKRQSAAPRYAHLSSVQQHRYHDVGARQHCQINHRLLAHLGNCFLPKRVWHPVVQTQLNAVVINEPFVVLHLGGPAAIAQVFHHGLRQARLACNGSMRPPLVLGIGNTRLDQDGELVQTLVDGRFEAQVIQKVKATSRHVGAAQERAVRPAQTST